MSESESTERISAFILEMNEAEGEYRSFSVGGLAVTCGFLPEAASESARVFGRLVALARRHKGWPVDQLAEHTALEPAEIEAIERGQCLTLTADLVQLLAEQLDLPPHRLLEVAGLRAPAPEVARAASEFAARSLPAAKLSPEEQAALEEFVKALSTSTPGA
jgi:transcriptional regulator with XRE-family HTH domain